DAGRREPAPEQLAEDLGRVADQADGDWLTRCGGPLGPTNRFVDRCGLAVQIARLDPPLDARRVDLDADRDAFVHRDGERLRAAHPTEPGREHDPARERPAEPLPAELAERLVRALQDALPPDVDPGARCHLA